MHSYAVAFILTISVIIPARSDAIFQKRLEAVYEEDDDQDEEYAATDTDRRDAFERTSRHIEGARVQLVG